MKVLDGHIEITPDVRFGKPRIAGRRITVSDIVIWHEYHSMSVADIERDFNLSRADIYAALAYYHDHKQDIDREINQDEEIAERFLRENPDKVIDMRNGDR